MRCPGNFLNYFYFAVGGVLLFCNFSYVFAISANKQSLVRRNVRVRRTGSSLGKTGPPRAVFLVRRRPAPGRIIGPRRSLPKNEGQQLSGGSRNVRTVRAIRGARSITFVPTVYPKKFFRWPIKMDKFWISGYYGSRSRGRLHAGLDLAANKGTPVYAASDGVVEFAKNAGSFGNMVLVKHEANFKSRYAHLNRIVVPRRKFIKRGELIGFVGNTGNVSGKNGNHLHFEVLFNNRPINPIKVLS